MHTKKQIEVCGNLYGYWVTDTGLSRNGDLVSIRSETNKDKTPYLKSVNSPIYKRVLDAIKKAEQ